MISNTRQTELASARAVTLSELQVKHSAHDLINIFPNQKGDFSIKLFGRRLSFASSTSHVSFVRKNYFLASRMTARISPSLFVGHQVVSLVHALSSQSNRLLLCARGAISKRTHPAINIYRKKIAGAILVLLVGRRAPPRAVIPLNILDHTGDAMNY